MPLIPVPIGGGSLRMSSKLSRWLFDITNGRHERNYSEFSVAGFIFAIAPMYPMYPPRTARYTAEVGTRLRAARPVDLSIHRVPAGFRRHLVCKTLINVFHCDSAEIRFVGKILIIQTFS